MKLAIFGLLAFCVVGSIRDITTAPEMGLYSPPSRAIGSLSPDGLDKSPALSEWKPITGWKKAKAHEYCPWCNTPRGSYSASRGSLERSPSDRQFKKRGASFAAPTNMRYMVGRYYEIRRVDKKSKSVVALCNDKSGVRDILDLWQTTMSELGYLPHWSRPCKCDQTVLVEYREVKK